MTVRAAAAVAVAVALLTGCSRAELSGAIDDGLKQAEDVANAASEKASEAYATARFCKAAYDVAQAVDDQDWNRAVAEGETLVAESPDEIRGQAQTVLDGARRYVEGDQSAVADPSFRAAAEDVRTYAEEHCDPR